MCRSVLRVVLLIAVLWPAWSPAFAQEATRADRLRAARHAKAERMEAPEPPGFIERSMASLEGRFSGNDGGTGGLYGLRPVLGGIRAGAGPAAGVRFDPTRGREDLLLAVDLRVSVRGYWSARAVGGYEAGGLSAHLLGRHRHMPQEAFFGVGPNSRRSDRAIFRLDETVAGGLGAAHGLRGVQAGLQGSFQGYRTGGGPSGDADFVVAGAFVELDTRDVVRLPEFGSRYSPAQHELRGLSLDAKRGILLSLEATRYTRPTGTEGGFTRAHIETQQFLPIRHGYQVLAFRQAAALTWEKADLPVYLMPSLGGSRSLRGFDTFRFRGPQSWLVNAEYRWYAWILLDFALFLDAGQVMQDVEDFRLDEIETSYGIGARLKSPSRVLGRLDVARSREGIRVWVQIGSFL